MDRNSGTEGERSGETVRQTAETVRPVAVRNAGHYRGILVVDSDSQPTAVSPCRRRRHRRHCQHRVRTTLH